MTPFHRSLLTSALLLVGVLNGGVVRAASPAIDTADDPAYDDG
jgi:hypothetical protein